MSNHLSDELLLRHLDGEGTHAAAAHVEACVGCRRRLARLRDVSFAIEGYSASLADPRSADRQRAALLAALRTSPKTVAMRASTSRSPVGGLVLAAAAAVLLAVAIQGPVAGPPKSGTPARSTGPGNSFIALPYSDENLTAEGAVVLQVEVPRSALMLAGVPASESRVSGRVKAEVVVGPDGLARAIRFLD